MHVFLRQPEDEIIEKYFSNQENIRHLVIFLQSIDALAYFAEVLHNYVNVNPNLKSAVYSSGKDRNNAIRIHTEKLSRMLDELVGILEFGNLRALARANYDAFVQAKLEKPKAGIWKILKEMKEPEVQLALGFILLLLRNVGKTIEEDK